MSLMKAVAFRGTGRIAIEERPKPEPLAGEAIVKITMTSISRADVRIVRGEHQVPAGLILGHEPVGVIDALGPGLEGEFQVGERVIVSAIDASGDWRLGNTIDGAWAEYLRVPDARANVAPIRRGLTDEDVMLLPEVFSGGMAAAEHAGIQTGDSVAIFGHGSAGLCAMVGARLRAAGLIIVVDNVDERLELALRSGATVAINDRMEDPVDAIRGLTSGGADVAIDTSSESQSLDRALRSVRTGGTVVGLGAGSASMLRIRGSERTRVSAPGGSERMRRLMSLVAHHRADLTALVTHHFALDDIEHAYELFAAERDGVIRVALTPDLELANRRHANLIADAEC